MGRELDSLEMRVQDVLVGIGRQEAWNNAEWTRGIKERLARIGREMGCKVLAAGCDGADAGEWLFDMVWIEYQDGCLIDVPFAMESEWCYSGLADDFEKLLVSRAGHRVMIFEARTRIQAEQQTNVFIDEVKRSRLTQPGDRYLFACLCHESGRFEIVQYVAGAAAAA